MLRRSMTMSPSSSLWRTTNWLSFINSSRARKVTITSALVVADWNSSSKRRASPGWNVFHEQFDFVGNGEAVIDDVAEIMGFLEAFQDILEGADEIENGNLGERGGFFRGQRPRRPVGGRSGLPVRVRAVRGIRRRP